MIEYVGVIVMMSIAAIIVVGVNSLMSKVFGPLPIVKS